MKRHGSTFITTSTNTHSCLGLQLQSVAQNVKKQVKNGHRENKQQSVPRYEFVSTKNKKL